MAKGKRAEKRRKKTLGLLRGLLREERKLARREPNLWRRLRRRLWALWLWAMVRLAHLSWEAWVGIFVFILLAITIVPLIPQEQSPKFGLEHKVAIESPDFLPSMTGALGSASVPGNRIDVLSNGDQFYAAELDAIAQAQHSINLEAFIYWGGEIGHKFTDALTAKARAGVGVRLLLDAVGSGRHNSDVIEELEKAGCKIGWYHPVRGFILSRFDNRTHREVLIIDGRVGFTGGAGVAQHWTGHAQDPDHWRDTQVRIEGPAVNQLQSAFSLKWLETTREMLAGTDYFPQIDPAGTLSIQTVLSEPETRSSPAKVLYYLSIICAQKSIFIANPYFVPDEQAIQILRAAKERGVDVKIMTAGEHNDHGFLARRNSSRLYGDLLEAGIEVYEYNPTMMHHKYMVCDGLWTAVGTINFDNQSLALNDEDSIAVYDHDFAGKFEQIFQQDMSACNRVELEEWRNRGLGVRILEWISAIFRRFV